MVMSSSSCGRAENALEVRLLLLDKRCCLELKGGNIVIWYIVLFYPLFKDREARGHRFSFDWQRRCFRSYLSIQHVWH